jgi:ABC-type sugar transport system permease subunit
MMAIRSTFTVPKRFQTISMALMAFGLLSIIGLWVTSGSSDDPKEQARFWASLLQNSVFFLLVVNASMFFICITTLAWGGWQMAFRRVPEAISAVVPVIGVICGAILLAIVFGDNHTIYHWTDAEHVQHDPILSHKKGFLNKPFFAIATIITIAGWSLLGYKMRHSRGA